MSKQIMDFHLATGHVMATLKLILPGCSRSFDTF